MRSNLIATLVVLIILSIPSLIFSQNSYLIDETSYVNKLAYSIYPIINVKRSDNYFQYDLTPISKTYYKKNGDIRKTVFFDGEEKIRVLKPKQNKAFNDFLNQTKSNELNSKNDKYDERKRLVYYVRESSLFEDRTFNNYDNRDSLILTTTETYKKSKSFNEDNILLYKQTKTYDTTGKLEKKQFEYSVEFQKNHFTIWPNYGPPTDRKINYSYLSDGLVKNIEVYETQNN